MCVYNVAVTVWLSHLTCLSTIAQSFLQSVQFLISFVFEEVFKSTYALLSESVKCFLK